MRTSDRRSPRSRGYEDIQSLRSTLPSYWWAEVSRVRALIDADAESAFEHARYFVHAAAMLAETSLDDGSRAHVAALCAASRKLSAIAHAQQHAPRS